MSNWKKRKKKLFATRKKKAYQKSSSSEPLMDSHPSEQPTTIALPKEDSQSSNICTSLKNLPLKDFIVCTVDNDYTVLGKGTDGQLKDAWLKLLSEYYEVKGDVSSKTMIEITSEINALYLRIKWVNVIVSCLRARYSPLLIKILRDEEYDFDFTPESYLDDLEQVINRETIHSLRLDELLVEYKQRNPEQKEKPTEEGFYQTVFNINKIEHAQYSIHTLNTYEYAVLSKRLEKYIEDNTKD